MEILGALMRAGLLSGRTVKIGEESIPAFELVRTLLYESPISTENPVWAYGLVVEVVGSRDGQGRRITLRNRHPIQETWGGESAYYKNVGIPLSIGAQMIADGTIEARGVQSPELALPSAPFFEQLALRGI